MNQAQPPGNLTGDAFVEEHLAKLRPVPPRDTLRADLGRALFLAEVRNMTQKNDSPAPVSKNPWQRLILWMQAIPTAGNWRGKLPGPRQAGTYPTIHGKEKKPMFSTLATVAVALTLVFGSAGAATLAAQDSMPNDTLYGVKTLTEDLRLQTATQAQERFNLELAFALRRMNEIASLEEAGQLLGESLANRLADHYEAALRLAAGMSGENQTQALEQLTTRLQQHEQALAGLGEGHPEDALLTQTRQRLQEQLHLAEDGLVDPEMLQQQLRTRQQNRIHQQDGTPEPGTTPGGQGIGTPVHNGPGGAQGTPVPGNMNQNQNQNQNGKDSDNGNQGDGGNGGDGPGGNGPGGGNDGDSGRNGPGDGSGAGDGGSGNGGAGDNGSGDNGSGDGGAGNGGGRGSNP